RVGFDSGDVLNSLGYRDLARAAARLAVIGAEDADDPAWLGATRYLQANLMVEVPGVASRAAERSLCALQAAAAAPNVRQMLGQLPLSASLACAVDNRSDDATAHLRAARHEARTLGGDPADGIGFNLLGFGPTNIALWRMAVAAELGEHGKA